jgi:DNA uptake protein ComE-like DNA-binding protein
MRWFLKEYLSFSRRERRTLLWVLIILIILLSYRVYISNKVADTFIISEQQRQEIDSFINSFQENPENPKTAFFKEEHVEERTELVPVYRDFNPNKVSRKDLLSMGLDEFVINNILAYRKAGGSFDTHEDLRKIYGMEKEVYETLLPYIDLPEKSNTEQNNEDADSLQKKILSVELNVAGFRELVKLEGLPPALAGRILKYRDLLGGFHYSGQLLEVYGLNDTILRNIESYITIDSSLIKQIPLQKASFSEMLRHPYLEKSDVRNFFRIKDYYGDSIRIEHIIENRIFPDSTLQRIKPYLSDN